MSKPNYRVTLSFDGERKLFVARAPELEHCFAEGATRAEAIAKLEEEIDAQLANMLSHGSAPPRSVDEEIFSGEISARISKSLHRELAYMARSEGLDVDQVVSEILAAGIEQRRSARVGGRRATEDGNRAPGNHYEGGGRGRFNGNARGNTQLLDDRANFIEYVRNLENGGVGGGGFNGRHGQRNNNRHGGRGGRGHNGGQRHNNGGQHFRPDRPDHRGRDHQHNQQNANNATPPAPSTPSSSPSHDDDSNA